MDKIEYINIFYKYASQDENLRQILTLHLQGKERHVGHIHHLYDVDAGYDRETEIQRMIAEADIILLLISANFNDKWYGSRERDLILARYTNSKEDIHIFPVLLRPCIWGDEVFSRLQVLPRNEKAVTLWGEINEQEQAFSSIAAGIGAKFDLILKKKYKSAAERYIAHKQYKEALQAYQEATKFDFHPYDAYLYHAKGILLNELKQFEKAYEAYQRATSIEPQNAQFWMDQGNFLAGRERYAEALTAYKEAEIHDTTNVAVFVAQGKAFVALNRNKEAHASYIEARKLDPQYAYFYDEKIGDALLKEGEYKDARKYYQSAINATPKNTSFLHKKIGDIFFQEADDEGVPTVKKRFYENALAAYDKSLSLYDDSALHDDENASERDFGRAQIYGSKARTLSSLTRDVEAIAAYYEALNHRAQDTYRSVLYKEYGDIYARLGMFREAIDAYDDAIALNLNYRLAYINKATALKEEANKTYQIEIEQAEVLYKKTKQQAEAKYNERLQFANEILNQAERLVNTRQNSI